MIARLPAAALFLALLTSAAAGDQDADEKLCITHLGTLPAAELIRACTTMIGEKVLRDSARAGAYVIRGQARLAGDRAGAMADFDAAIALDGGSYDAHLARGNLNVALRNFEAALADFNLAEKIDPRAASVHLARGNLFGVMNRYAEAFADAGFAPVPVGLAAGFVNLRCRAAAYGGAPLAEAQRYCEQAMWLPSPIPAAIEGHGMVALKMKRFQTAWNDFDQLVKLQPNVARSWYGRGLAASGLGRAEAKADLARAVAINPQVEANFARTGAGPEPEDGRRPDTELPAPTVNP